MAQGGVRSTICRKDPMDKLGLEMPLLADIFERLHGGFYCRDAPMAKDEAAKAIDDLRQKNRRACSHSALMYSVVRIIVVMYLGPT
jgi:hypothetical protein